MDKTMTQDQRLSFLVKTVKNWMSAHPDVMDRVIFNVFKDEDKEYYEQELC